MSVAKTRSIIEALRLRNAALRNTNYVIVTKHFYAASLRVQVLKNVDVFVLFSEFIAKGHMVILQNSTIN